MNKTVSFFLFLIMLLGVVFRVYHLPLELWYLSGADEQRDMLVARHIAEFGEHLTRGPLASGSSNALMNSPVYYYYLAALWFIGRNPLAVQLLWAMVLSASIPVAFIVGYRVWDWKLGIIAAFLIAIHPEMVWMSRHISQPYLLPLCALLFFAVFWTRKISTVTMGLACFLLILPLHLHYGSLLLIPGGGAWLVTQYFSGHKKKTVYDWMLPALIAEASLLAWVFLTYRYVPFDQFRFLSQEVQSTAPSFLRLFMSKIELLRDALWWNGWSMPVVVATGIMVVLAIEAYRVRKDIHFRNRYMWFAGIFLIALIFAGFNRTNANSSYLLSLVPMAILFIAVCLRVLFMQNIWVGTSAGLLMLMMFLPNTLRQVSAKQAPSVYDHIRVVSERIADDYETLVGANEETPRYALVAIVDNLPYDGWGTGGMWYFLEHRYNQPLVRLSDTGVNFIPRQNAARLVYLLCDLEDIESNACVRRFRQARSYLQDGEVNIYASDTYSIWRFSLQIDHPRDVTHVYEDMFRNPQ